MSYTRRLKKLLSALAVQAKPTHACREAAISAAAERLGHELPAVLVEHYRLAGKHRLARAMNRIYLPDELEVEQDGLLIAEENQRVVFWGIATDALTQADPPVRQLNPDEERWYDESSTLSGWLLHALAWNAIAVFPAGKASITAAKVSRLRAKLTSLAEWTAELSFLGSGSVFMVFPQDGVVYVAARTKTLLRAQAATFDLQLDAL